MNGIIDLKFFGLFDPWEAEAVGCFFNTFVRQQYERIFADIHANLHHDNIRFIGPDVSVDNYRHAFNLDPGPSRRVFLEEMISRGLKTLVRALEFNDNEGLACFMAHFLAAGPTVALTLSETMRVAALPIQTFPSRHWRSSKLMADKRIALGTLIIAIAMTATLIIIMTTNNNNNRRTLFLPGHAIQIMYIQHSHLTAHTSKFRIPTHYSNTKHHQFHSYFVETECSAVE
ncbi:hypothetical protein F4777DRAFT_67002 [Nemania sp. FL0916]|nr:hypothetical protein F4777DRAFT_67002 [Nemania sp. FL0916]